VSIALHGNLRDFGIGEVFQLIGQQRKTGVLQVRGSQGEVELRFEDGCVVSAAPVGAFEDEALGDLAVRCGALPREAYASAARARAAAGDGLRAHLVAANLSLSSLHEVEDLLTRETLFALLRWQDGSFRFAAQPIPHDRPPESLIAAEQFLMDGLRMLDEWRTFHAELPAETQVFRRRGGIEEYRRSPAGRASSWPVETEQLLLLIDGRSSVRRVIDLSRLGTFLGMRIFVDLARDGWIEALLELDGDATHVFGRRSGLQRRRGAVAVLPFVALGLLLLLALARTPPSAPGAATLPIPRSAIADARAGAEMLRVRHLALAASLAQGRAIDSLAELPAWPNGTASALTAEASADYYLAHRDGGTLILAPER
jgi:hypothetical protein